MTDCCRTTTVTVYTLHVFTKQCQREGTTLQSNANIDHWQSWRSIMLTQDWWLISIQLLLQPSLITFIAFNALWLCTLWYDAVISGSTVLIWVAKNKVLVKRKIGCGYAPPPIPTEAKTIASHHFNQGRFKTWGHRQPRPCLLYTSPSPRD